MPHYSSNSSDSASTGTPEAEYSGMSTPVTEFSQFNFTKEVAVVGLACRVAGGNNNPEELWQSLLQKQDASGEIPAMRWEPYLRRDPRNAKILKETTSRGYFLDHLEDFDAQFFGISPKEAEQMDPQQRLSLEVTWEALENSGIPAKSLSGSDTAVFWGVNSDDYSKLVLEDLPNVEAWMGIGTAYCGVPNRISYHLNLMGPSTAVDAACASSLVAVHHGVQSIILGESKVAIVGGVNALCGPGLTRVLDKAGAVSPEGRCCSFDNDVKGYGRGEGAAAIVLKNLSTAIHDGDHIMAVIKGTAVGQDGKTNGIMAPNAKAQQLVARNALKAGNIDPLTVGYVEAHATSTPLGDPTEVSAMAEVYGADRQANSPCFIGSIKPNIGHLEAGAGAMGFIKAVMAVEKGMLAPQANLTTLTKKIDWKRSGLKVVQEEIKWPSTEELRRAAICSYGYGGSVSHAIIEQFALPESPDLTSVALPSVGPALLLLSGPQEKRLAVQAGALGKWLQSEGSEQDLKNVASTLAVRRDHHDYRAGLVVDSKEDAIKALTQLAEGSQSANAWISQNRVFGNDVNKDVVWVFSGHGAQWAGMGQELLENPVFLQAIEPLDAIIQAEIKLSPIALLRSGQFEASDHVQILTYIMQIGIAAVLNSHGVYPQAIIGHSVGEIAASVVAGALTPEEGAILITRRSVLYRQVMGQGGMILVSKPYAEMAEELANDKNLVVAIDSSPSSCVVAGPTAAVAQKAAELKERSIQSFTVRTDIAFHSPELNQLVAPLLKALRGSLKPKPATNAKLYSTSLSDPRGQDLRDATYWVNNMVNPVHLTPAVEAALADSYRIFLEVSSHPLVSHSINETVMAAGVEEYSMIPTLARKKPSAKSILNAISQLHSRGAAVDFKTTSSGAWAVGVPNTRWLHKPTWRQVEAKGAGSTQQTHDVEKHTLLGQRIGVAGTDTVVYTTRLDNDSKPFPGSHPLHGTEIVPAAGLVNTFVKATGATVLNNVVLRVPVAINAPRSVQVVAERDEVKIMSRLIPENPSDSDNSSWVTHTTTRWETTPESPALRINVEAAKARIGTRLRDDFSIDYLDKVGVSAMGFPWAITEHYGTTREMIARVDVAPEVATGAELPWDASSWAPILDAATSVGSTIFFDQPRLRMPAQIERVDIFTKENPPKVGWLYVQEASDSALASHVSVCDEDGNVMAKFTSMRFAEIEGTPGVSGSMDSLVHQMAWPPAVPAEEPLPIDHIVIISEDQELVEKYAVTLPKSTKAISFSKAGDLAAQWDSLALDHKRTAIAYLPGRVSTLQDVSKATEDFTWQLLEITKFVINNSLPVKIFAITSNIADGSTPTALAQAPLVGLSRVIASEHSDQFGGLIDTEVSSFPLSTMRYIQGADIIRIRDGMPRTMRFRPLPRHLLIPADKGSQSSPALMPRPDGTYLITGGLGALGLEVADFLVSKGAQRVILVSRRALPPRRTWSAMKSSDALAPAIAKIQDLESRGAFVHVLALDISVPSAAQRLTEALDQLALPPVRGVVHAAGVLDNELVTQTTRGAFSRVLAPKVTGGLVLNEVFPAGTTDFFVLFSSCGQLVGFTGQSSYGAGNAFLDTLATHRRQQGDRHAVAIQWTSWRGLGMGASTDFINAELESKGITDVSADEAFGAWMHLAKYDIDHAVVLRSLAFDADEPLPTPVLADIAQRRAPTQSSATESSGPAASSGSEGMPPTGPARKAYLDEAIRSCVAVVLHLAADEVDSKAALADLGVDSVMTVTLRRQLQQSLKVKVPPTLTWSHPTVSHLVSWFSEKLE
ncbi:unnamed protein product [Penicillium bialowiezense]